MKRTSDEIWLLLCTFFRRCALLWTRAWNQRAALLLVTGMRDARACPNARLCLLLLLQLVRTPAQTPASMHTCLHTPIHPHMHMPAHACTHLHINTCKCECNHECKHIETCLCVRTHCICSLPCPVQVPGPSGAACAQQCSRCRSRGGS